MQIMPQKYKKTLKYGQRILALHGNVIMHNEGPPCSRDNRLLKLTQNLTCLELFRKENSGASSVFHPDYAKVDAYQVSDEDVLLYEFTHILNSLAAELITRQIQA